MTDVIKVISGGQTGADIGGLIAADLAGIETGGWAPPGWMTEKGMESSLQEYGLKEHKTRGYIARTYENVKDSDATIRFACNFDSPGEVCTFQAIKKYGKPVFDVDVNNPVDHSKVVEWLKNHDVKVLNVAGNRESGWPGMKDFVIEFLGKVF